MLFASDLADCLAQDAEAVCRHYLSAGRRTGNYWLVRDVGNNKGRSLYVHLVGPRAGRWTDYVALGVMLRLGEWALSCWLSAVFMQHNVRTRGIA